MRWIAVLPEHAKDFAGVTEAEKNQFREMLVHVALRHVESIASIVFMILSGGPTSAGQGGSGNGGQPVTANVFAQQWPDVVKFMCAACIKEFAEEATVAQANAEAAAEAEAAAAAAGSQQSNQ